MIRLEALEFAYPDGEFRLRIPELHVPAGTSTAVIGPSGSGKTTLLRLVAGILPASSGRVVTNGVDLGQLGDAGRRDFRIRNVGLVFQEFELLEYLSVLDNLLLPFRIGRTLSLPGRDAARARAAELARPGGARRTSSSRLPGPPLAGRAPAGGRVSRPRHPARPSLLADEPTGNLDPAHEGGACIDELIAFVDEDGATLVVGDPRPRPARSLRAHRRRGGLRRPCPATDACSGA